MKRLLSVLLVLATILPVSAILLSATPVLATVLTETLRPNATGNYTNLAVTAGTNWEAVDDIAYDDYSTYVYRSTDTQAKDAYNLENGSIPAGAQINSVTVHFRVNAYNAPGSKQAQPFLLLGVSETAGTVVTVPIATFAFTSYSEILTRPGGGNWTVADIASLQVGIGLKGGEDAYRVKCTQIYVVVDYSTLPIITTQGASNVAISTARLNSVLIDDGGESCNVSFQYHALTEDWVTCDNTSWVAGYTTGQYPYADVDNLIPNTLYYFRARTSNTVGTDNGTALTFTTRTSVLVPTNFKAFPETSSVSLSWTKGEGSTNTLIRQKAGAYADNITDGTQVYLGALNSYAHTGLSSGHTYYYSAWGVSGDNYSDNYTFVMATTSGAPTGAAPPGTPDTPTGWFQTPNYTNFSEIPLYSAFNAMAVALDMPLPSFWFLLGIFGCIGFGVVVLAVSKHAVAAMIALASAFGIASLIKLLPMFMMAFMIIFLVGAWQFSRTGRAG